MQHWGSKVLVFQTKKMVYNNDHINSNHNAVLAAVKKNQLNSLYTGGGGGCLHQMIKWGKFHKMERDGCHI